jgi:hypothetical protein
VQEGNNTGTMERGGTGSREVWTLRTDAMEFASN